MTESRRLHERFDVALPVVVLEGTREIDAQTINVSLGGMLIATPQPLAYGTDVALRVALPGLPEPTEIRAIVRWVEGDHVGVQFTGLRAKETWALNQLMKPR